MKDPAFVRAYDSIAPNEAVRERIRNAVRTQAAHRPRPFPLRRTLWIIAATICLLSMLTICGYAAWEWTLPEPTYYDSSRGDVIIRSEQYFASLPAADPAELTDEAFLLRARELLSAAGHPQPEDAESRIIRQENLKFSRNEATIEIGSERNCPSVTFNADTGALLQLVAGSAAYQDAGLSSNRRIDPEQIAWDYAGLLDFSPEQAVMDIQKQSDSVWGFHIYRLTPQGVRNPSDSLMLSVHTKNGTVLLAAIFYTPLIDDADNGAQPISQEEARAIVESGVADLSESEAWMGPFEGYHFFSTELSVVRPDWSFTGLLDTAKGRPVIPAFTRLAWVVTFSKDGNAHSDMYRYEFWIDYYTGQLLGGAALQAQ